MRLFVCLLLNLLAAHAGVAAPPRKGMLVATGLTCEHRTNPMGIEIERPRLSWKLRADGRNVRQSAYQLRVATAPTFTGKTLVWTGPKVISGESVLQAYGGPALRPGQRYYWQVMVWGAPGVATSGVPTSGWSEPAYWEMGLPAAQWRADWIEPEPAGAKPSANTPAYWLRRAFSLRSKPTRARAYVTSHGFYELHLNGQRVGNDLLTPGWTVYPKRLQYQVYDITPLLSTGPNVVGAVLGEGWYRSTLGWENNRGFYGDRLGLRCQLHVQYADGTDEWLGTDANWKATANGPIRRNELYYGEDYDARLEQPGWSKPGFSDGPWTNVLTATYPPDNVVATTGVPVQRIREIRPSRIFRTPEGTLVADMGQNMVGWVRLTVAGPAGTTVMLRHAEVLDKQGNFYTANLRSAKQQLRYTLRGGGRETYEPRFTFMGFRYVAVDGFPGELTPDNVVGVVVHSAMPPTGTFESSHAGLNQLQHNIEWGQRGNFVDVPTDCPQRDERLGWTGDAQAFCRTAAFNMDVAAFFTKWLADVAADQAPDGAVPFVVPDVLRQKSGTTIPTSAGWGDVAVITPWTMYLVYGDRDLLARQYPSMKAYVEHIRKKAGKTHLWRGGSVFGDWLFYRPGINSHPEPDGYTSPDLIATAFYAYSANLLKQAATALGNTADAAEYDALFGQIREAFGREYVTPSGRVASDSQTAYVLALMFDLLPTDLRPKAVEHLVADIRARKNHLSTGFLGTPYLCHVLSDNGRTDVAYDLLLQESYPSWLYPVKMGATTIWERWDGQKPDSTFQDVGMNSFNHYAYGAIGDWMYRVVAGLEIGQPGYRHIRIQPQPTSRLQFARARFESPYGPVRSGWERSGNQMLVDVVIPPNTTATVRLPGTQRATEGGRNVADVVGATAVRRDGPDLLIEVGSGTYQFAYPVAGTN